MNGSGGGTEPERGLERDAEADLGAVQRYLHEHIPISHHLGAVVHEAGGESVRISAPLEPNLNHRGTAFGGSISALAILAGWTWMYVNLRREGFDGRIVIQSNSVDYVAPATGEFTAVCRAPTPERWSHFLQVLRERGRSRLELNADVTADSRLAATFRGQYVALT